MQIEPMAHNRVRIRLVSGQDIVVTDPEGINESLTQLHISTSHPGMRPQRLSVIEAHPHGVTLLLEKELE